MYSLYLPLDWRDLIVAATTFLAYLFFDLIAKGQKHRRARILVATLAFVCACVFVTVLWPVVVVGWKP